MTAKPLDLDDIVLREASRLASEGNATVSIAAVSAAHVLGDRGQLARAVKNLLDNAGRHASPVTLALAERDANAVLTVSDDGPGIPESAADRIFRDSVDSMRRGRPVPGGTGLGLAIAQEIVERHGGILRLVNPGHSGAIFEMSLPAAGEVGGTPLTNRLAEMVSVLSRRRDDCRQPGRLEHQTGVGSHFEGFLHLKSPSLRQGCQHQTGSVMANLDPMHMRGPSPKGRKACAGRPSDRASVKRSGSKLSGASQYLGLRWIA